MKTQQKEIKYRQTDQKIKNEVSPTDSWPKFTEKLQRLNILIIIENNSFN